jgi:broad specificity phosphatase PhoE
MVAMIYLCRHGNREPDGPEPVRLTALGHSQAERIAMALASRDIQAIYASPKIRAIETAKPLARKVGKPIEVWPCLIEHNSYGPLDYSAEEIAKLGANLNPEMRLTGTPLREEKPFAYDRALFALSELRSRHGDESVAIFAHDCFNSIFIWAYFSRGSLQEEDRYWQGDGCVNVLNHDLLTVPNEALESIGVAS